MDTTPEQRISLISFLLPQNAQEVPRVKSFSLFKLKIRYRKNWEKTKNIGPFDF